MKTKLKITFRFLSITLILLIALSGSTALLSGCGSSDAATKKGKSKKSKKQLSDEEDIDAEEPDAENAKVEPNSEKATEKATNDDSEEKKPANSVDESEKSKSERNSKKSNSSEKVKDNSSKSAKNEANEGETIWSDLMKGNQKFISGKHTLASYISVRKQLVAGQKPEAIILGCADSRVPPELVFDKNLGELFVVRAAGNIADSVELGSIEYAIEHLHPKLLVVLGHESCGAVAATVSNEKMPTKNLTAIVNQIAPALEGSKSCPLGGKMNNSCVELNVEQSAKDILANSPIIKKAVKEGELTIIRAVYQLESGKVVRLD